MVKRTMLIALLLAGLVLSLASGCSPITILTGPDNAGQGLGTALRQGAIKGMVEALDDPYTAYLDAETYQLSLSGLEGRFDGIGATVTRRDDKIIVVEPFPDSPAEKAGIRANDEVLEIDGHSVSEMSLVEAVLLVRGPRGTPVSLLVLHDGETEPVDIEVIRDEIEVASVHFRMIGDIAYIKITDFSGRTDDELLSALNSLIKENARGIILDPYHQAGSTPGGYHRPAHGRSGR